MSRRSLILLAILLMTVGACARGQRGSGRESAHHEQQPMIEEAAPQAGDVVCVLVPTAGNSVAGTVRFHVAEGMTVITARVSGLQPGGKHAFHIHEFGDQTAADGASAGGHFNPHGHDHGGPDSKIRHAGDLGNLSADGAGEAFAELRVADLPPADIVGRSVVIHAGQDDLVSQPAGNAGPRIAVGVIGWAKP